MRITLVAVTIFLIATTVLADLTIKQEMTTEGQSPFGEIKNFTIITLKYKGDRYRVDVEVKGVVGSPLDSTTIGNHKTGAIYRISHSQKTFDVVTPDELQKQAEFAADHIKKQGLLPNSRPVLRATGRKETINGYVTEEYVAEREGDTFTYWVAPSLAKFVPFLAKGADPGGAVYNLRFPDPASFPGVPIRMTMVQNVNGNRMVTAGNVILIDEKPLTDAEFELPKGYKERK